MSDPVLVTRLPPVAKLPLPGQGLEATMPPDQVAKARQAAKSFEAMAIGQFLAPMFNTVDGSKGMFGGGEGEAAWRPMLTEEIAKKISAAGGIGIANSVMQEMLRTQEHRSKP
jgi:Rod binding domain-containing protein